MFLEQGLLVWLFGLIPLRTDRDLNGKETRLDVGGRDRRLDWAATSGKPPTRATNVTLAMMVTILMMRPFATRRGNAA